MDRKEREMDIVNLKLSEIKPYENNPRYNDDAVDKVAKSIQEFGFKVPIVVDKNGVIIAGHTRLKAAKKLGMKEAPCIVAKDLTEEQARAFRLADNKTSEFASWDDELLREELEAITGIKMGEFGFDLDECPSGGDEPYTTKVNVPQYEVTGASPMLSDLVDTTKTNELLEEIDNAEGITEEERQFLRKAAMRHLKFNYRNVAGYYAGATQAMQDLMERSALVIIDYEDAIANGYAKLKEALEIDLNEGE